MIFRILFPALILLFPLFVTYRSNPTEYNKPMYWAGFGAYTILALAYFYVIEYKTHVTLKRKHIALVLQKFYQSILQEIKSRTPSLSSIEPDKLPFRINIMLPKFSFNPCHGKLNVFKTCIFIRYSYNMEKAADRSMVLSSGRGAAGMAYKDNKIYIADIRKMDQPGYPPWGLTAQEKKLAEGSNSIISIPILHRKKKEKVIGVLNIDTPNHLENTPFNDKDFQEFLQKETKSIALFIK